MTDRSKTPCRAWSFLAGVLLLALVGLAAAQIAPTARVQISGVAPEVVLLAQQDVFGEDLARKDGPLSKVGLDLALLYREHQQALQLGTAAAFRPSNPLIRARDGLVVVDFVAGGDAGLLRGDLEALGLRNAAVYGSYVSGLLPIEAIPVVAALESLGFARPALATTNVGLTTSQGDVAMRSDLVRLNLGFDGTGVTVGTLSDSYDCQGGAATDVGSNDLPVGVTVLQEEVGCGSGSDEGRGMMQLIHDVAPGSAQAFHSAFNGVADFAQGIIDLQVAGSDVIVDDVIYFAEPMFQDGPIAQAVDQVVAAGVPYFSSAGNNARQSYESAFRSSGTCPAGLNNCVAHDFDPGAGVDVFQSLTIPANSSVTFSFQWDQPFFSVSGAPGTQNDMDIWIFDSTGTTILAQGATNNINGDAVELAGIQNNTGSPQTVNVVITKFTTAGGPDPGRIKYVLFGGNGVIFNEFDTDSATSFGHANAAGAASVAAAFFAQTPEFGQSPPLLESFSSGGGIPILFSTSGNPVNILRDKPEFTAPDGTNTTFFGQDVPQDIDTFPNFFGTSAAAPHAAAVAALMLDAVSGLTPAQIYQGLKNSAIDMGPVGFDNDSGFGLIQADTAVGAVGAGSLSFSASSYTVNENAGSVAITVQRTGGSGAVTVQYQTGGGTATPGSDYAATSGTLSWGNGDISDKTFTVTILDDAQAEGNETVTLTLANPTGGAVLGTSSATLNISDDDTNTATLAFTRGPGVPSGSVTAVAGQEVAVLQVVAGLTAGSADLTLQGVNVTGVASTGASLADIAAVNLYLDADSNGIGEQLIATGTFSGGSATLTLTSARNLTAGASETYVLTYRLSSNLTSAPAGRSLAWLLAPAGLVGLGLARARRRALALLLLSLLLVGLSSCVITGPRTYSSSLSSAATSAASGVTVTTTGLPLPARTVEVDTLF